MKGQGWGCLILLSGVVWSGIGGLVGGLAGGSLGAAIGGLIGGITATIFGILAAGICCHANQSGGKDG